MDQATHNKIVSFIWGIADDVLRDLFKRGKYPDVILPMCVLRRLDAVLEPTKKKVLDTKKTLDDARICWKMEVLKPSFAARCCPTPRVTALNAACLDFSVARKGYLTAYQWSGERELMPDSLVSVPAVH